VKGAHRRLIRVLVLIGFVVAINVAFLLWVLNILDPAAAECVVKAGRALQRCRDAADSSARFLAGIVILAWVLVDLGLGVIWWYGRDRLDPRVNEYWLGW
jgi:hypothetical protein